MSPKKKRRGFHACECLTCQQHSNRLTTEVHRAINRFLPATDERSRRLLAGSLAHEHGRGGIALVARITGLSPHTIRRGRREWERSSPTRRGRIRRKGAGPKPIEKKVPGS
jgi:hypothetical protein